MCICVHVCACVCKYVYIHEPVCADKYISISKYMHTYSNMSHIINIPAHICIVLCIYVMYIIYVYI